jgi:hypothetical protein
MFGDDPIEQIRLAVKELEAEDRRGWPGPARSDQLVEVLEVAERLQGEIVRAVADWDARTDWALDGALSPRSWLAHRAPISRAGASRLVGMGRLTREFETTGEALHAGDLSCAHLEVLAPMVRHREPEYTRNEEVLVATAATMKADEFAELARAWRSIADDELSPLDAHQIHERRNLHVHKSLYGMGVLNGDLDAEATATLLAALDLACPPTPPAAPSPRDRSRNDAPTGWSTSPPRSSPPRARAAAYPSVSTSPSTTPPSPARRPTTSASCAATSNASAPSPSKPHYAWRATAPSDAWSCAASPKSSTSAARPASSPQRYRAPSSPATAAAHGPTATDPPCGATTTTSSGGNTAAPPTKKTAASCADATTSSATKAAGTSNDATTEPTKPKNQPPTTSPLAATDAHHPTPDEAST